MIPSHTTPANDTLPESAWMNGPLSAAGDDEEEADADQTKCSSSTDRSDAEDSRKRGAVWLPTCLHVAGSTEDDCSAAPLSVTSESTHSVASSHTCVPADAERAHTDRDE